VTKSFVSIRNIPTATEYKNIEIYFLFCSKKLAIFSQTGKRENNEIVMRNAMYILEKY